MFEIEATARRDRELNRLGGVEHKIYLSVAGVRASGVADPTRENTSPEGKASSVQFIRFPLSAAQQAKFRIAGTPILCGIDHPAYGHIALIPEDIRTALAEDLA